MSQNQSVKRAITILEYLAKEGRPKDLAVISQDVAMHKSTAYRFLSTLAEAGYVRQDTETRRYSLGAKVAWLAAEFLEMIDIRQLARPILEHLAQETGETIHLGILEGDEAVYVDKISGQQAVQMRSRVGARVRLHSTGLGKAMLANLPEYEWRRYVSKIGLERRTANTIVEPQAFYEHLRQIRKQGYSIDNMEDEASIRCVAAPIRDHSGQTVAALSVSGSIITMTLEKVESLVPLAQKAALAISEQLGWNYSDRAPGIVGADHPEPPCDKREVGMGK